MEVKVVRFVNFSRRREPGQQSHRNHDGLLDSSGPSEVSAEHRGKHDADQKNEVLPAFDMQTPAGLHIFNERMMRLDFLFVENILVENVERDQQDADGQSPLREQPQRPLERNAAQKSEE